MATPSPFVFLLLFLLVLLLAPFPASASVLYRTGGHLLLRYHVIDEPTKTRDAALKACNDQGYPYLASILNSTINEILKNLTMDNATGEQKTKLGHFYISGVRVGDYDGNNSVFEWQGGLGNGTRVPMPPKGNWKSGQPDNSKWCNKIEGQTAMTMYWTGDWDDEGMDTSMCRITPIGAICEKFATDTMSLTLTPSLNIITRTSTATSSATASSSMTMSATENATHSSSSTISATIKATNSSTLLPTSSATPSNSFNGTSNTSSLAATGSVTPSSSFNGTSNTSSLAATGSVTRVVTASTTPNGTATSNLATRTLTATIDIKTRTDPTSATITKTIPPPPPPPTNIPTKKEDAQLRREGDDKTNAEGDSGGCPLWLCIVIPLIILLLLVLLAGGLWYLIAACLGGGKGEAEKKLDDVCPPARGDEFTNVCNPLEALH